MHSFYEIFPDRGDLGCLIFVVGGGALIFERIEIFWGEGRGVVIIFERQGFNYLGGGG